MGSAATPFLVDDQDHQHHSNLHVQDALPASEGSQGNLEMV